jgi:hypothetical protein
MGYSFLKRLGGNKIYNQFIICLLKASTGKSYNYKRVKRLQGRSKGII